MGMLGKILTEAQEAVVEEERELLDALEETVLKVGEELARETAAEPDGSGPAGELDDLARARRSLDPLFLVVLAGARGAPTDLLADALLGRPILGERPAASESGAPRRVRRAAGGEESAVEVVHAEGPALDWVELVSSPDGVGGDLEKDVDLALVLTAASRPLSEPDREVLRQAGERARRLMIVVDEVEMLRLSEDVTRMEEAVAAAAEPILGWQPSAFGVSTARVTELPAPAASLVGALARQVEAALRDPEVVGPKLRRVAEAVRAVAESTRSRVDGVLAELAGDLETVGAIEEELEVVDEAGSAAHREAAEALDGAFDELTEGVARLVRRATRPLSVGGAARLEERLAAGPAAALDRRLAVLDEEVDRAVEGAAARAAEGIAERLRGRPTPLPPVSSEDALSEGARSVEAPGDRGGVTNAAERRLDGLTTLDWAKLLAPVRRDASVSVALLVAGLLFAAVPFLWRLAGPGGGLLPVALGCGLGGAAVLASFGLLDRRRRRLTETVGRRFDAARQSAEESLAGIVEARVARARERVLRPVAPWTAAVTRKAGAAEAARDELHRLGTAARGLLDRLP